MSMHITALIILAYASIMTHRDSKLCPQVPQTTAYTQGLSAMVIQFNNIHSTKKKKKTFNIENKHLGVSMWYYDYVSSDYVSSDFTGKFLNP